MAHVDVTRASAGVAEPHQSTVAAILRAVGQGLFTVAEGELLIDRLRRHRLPVPGNGSRPSAGGELASEAIQNSPSGTVQ